METKPPFMPEYRVHSQGIAAVINAEGLGIHVDNKRFRVQSMDGDWQFTFPAEFANFVGKGDNCIISITLIKNNLVEAPIIGAEPKLIKPA